MRAAELLRGLQKFLTELHHAAFALDHFQQHRRDPRREALPQVRRVIQPDESHARNQRLKRLAILFRPGGGERAQRPAVKRVFHRQDFVALEGLGGMMLARVSARQLDRAFDDLGAGVGEKHPVQPRQPRQLFRQRRLVAVVEQIRNVQQRSRPRHAARRGFPGARSRENSPPARRGNPNTFSLGRRRDSSPRPAPPGSADGRRSGSGPAFRVGDLVEVHQLVHNPRPNWPLLQPRLSAVAFGTAGEKMSISPTPSRSARARTQLRNHAIAHDSLADQAGNFLPLHQRQQAFRSASHTPPDSVR